MTFPFDSGEAYFVLCANFSMLTHLNIEIVNTKNIIPELNCLCDPSKLAR